MDVGSGAYGSVFSATVKETGEKVAIKKIGSKFEEGVHVTTLREIKLLNEIDHEYIIKLVDVFANKQNIYLVMPLMQADLEELIKEKDIMLSNSVIKAIMKAMLEGLEHLHAHRILHLDIKPANVLLGNGQLKIIDFGFAQYIDRPNPMTPNVITRWYRPPELLFGANYYGPAADMWSVGCVFAQLLLRIPFLVAQPDSDIGQLAAIFQVRGTPTESNWPGVTSLPNYVAFSKTAPQPLSEIFTAATEDILDLLEKMLQLNPKKRITAAEALQHRYFTGENDPPVPLSEIPLPKK